ncbi:MAG TPA: hypothetical protein VLA66_13760, partial [Thermoanaerobaculia bacterium]|nr:hypothetical protein [Thermoanaerobaculia bacterium]
LAEISATRAGRVTTAVTVGLFLLASIAGPLFELTAEPAVADDGEAVPVRVLPGARQLSTAWRRLGWSGLLGEIQDAIDRAERFIDRDARLARWLRPPTQAALLGLLREGNDEVVAARGGWLFLRDAIAHTVGPGFLNRSDGRVDAAAGLVDFHRQLAARGVRLVVLPVPEKEQIHPRRLIGAELPLPVRNVDFARFLERLECAGVAVFDPAPTLAALVASGEPAYLPTDTHWGPAAVERVAADLADYLRGELGLRVEPGSPLRHRGSQLRFDGDLVRLLDLPAGDARYPPVSVRARRVHERKGPRFDAARARSSVLVLGDSFALIYSRQRGRLQAAGLADQLAFRLGTPVRLIGDVRNNSLTRRIRWLGRDYSKLRETRYLVYEFAARDLTMQDWTTSREGLPRYPGRPLTARRTAR